ncbi:MAG: hypothetical protein V4469_04905 [Patescibacteria group bacterium]
MTDNTPLLESSTLHPHLVDARLTFDDLTVWEQAEAQAPAGACKKE